MSLNGGVPWAPKPEAHVNIITNAPTITLDAATQAAQDATTPATNPATSTAPKQ